MDSFEGGPLNLSIIEADDDIGFTQAFTHFRTGAPCNDKLRLLNVLLAEGLNLGLSKMAEASNTHGYWPLSRILRWHVETDAIKRALPWWLPRTGVWAIQHQVMVSFFQRRVRGRP